MNGQGRQHAAARSAHLEAIGHSTRPGGIAALAEIRLGTDEKSSCNCPRPIAVQLEGFQSAEAARAYTRARDLAEQRGDPRSCHGNLWSLASGQRCRQNSDCRSLSNRLQQLTADDATTIESAGASQRMGDLFIRRRAGSVARAQRSRASNSMIPSATASPSTVWRTRPGHVCGYFGAQAHWMLGYPDKAARSDAKHWHWPSGYLIRSVPH